MEKNKLKGLIIISGALVMIACLIFQPDLIYVPLSFITLSLLITD